MDTPTAIRRVNTEYIYLAGHVYDSEVMGYGGYLPASVKQAQREIVLLSQSY